MTTTPAPTELDTLKALERAAAPAPWIVQDANEDYPHEYGAYWVLTNPGAESDDTIMELRSGHRADAELVATMRNNWTALLDQLAKTTRERESLARRCAVRFEETQQAERERDAAREELAKTRAELDTVTRERHQAIDLLRTIWYGTVNAPARERWLRLMAEANPATTAEPADDDPAYHYDLTAPQHNVPPDAACNCQSTNGSGPWHPRGDTPTCPTAAPAADEPKADHDECDGTDHPGMTCDQYDTALEPTPPGQLVLAPLTDEPAAG